MKNSLTFIGMPGVGKSTLGKRLAKRLGYQFIDCDHLILDRIKMGLQAYLVAYGDVAFIKMEADVICSIPAQTQLIISPGGSLVYSERAVTYLKTFTSFVYLKDSLEHIDLRISDLESRGIVGLNGRSLAELYQERGVLYETIADYTLNLCEVSEQQALDQLEALCQVR